MERRRTIPGRAIEPHEAPVRAFPRRVAAQGERCVRHPGFNVVARLEMGHELVDDLQVDLLQTLTLGETPLLVPPLEELTTIELDGPAPGASCPRMIPLGVTHEPSEIGTVAIDSRPQPKTTRGRTH